MTSPEKRQLDAGTEDLPPLSKSVTTKDRQTLKTDGHVWYLLANADGGGRVAIDFRPILKIATPRFIAIAKRFVAARARTLAAKSLVNIASALSRAARYWFQSEDQSRISWHRITLAQFQALLTHGMKSPGAVGGNDFIHMRVLYHWGCHVAALPDFSSDIAMALQGIRAPGNLKGQKVLGSDPTGGPFIPEEVTLIYEAIKAGEGDPKDLVIAQLFEELGLRPIQVLRSRWSGLKRYEVKVVEAGLPRELVRYTLDIPRAKVRGEYRVERTRPISTLLGDRLTALRPATVGETTPLLSWLSDETTSKDIALIAQRWANDANLLSPRTNDQLKANPTRFRYSIATEAARDGASRMQIADLLDHVDLQNVEVYIDAAGTVMDQIESKLDDAFGSAIDHFLGRTVSIEDPQPFEGLDKRIIPGVFPQLPEVPQLFLGIGACGLDVRKLGVCKLAPPISCYTCAKFGAFREAPHKQIGDSLEHIARTQFNGQVDARVGGELVRTIQAIRELERQLEAEGTA